MRINDYMNMIKKLPTGKPNLSKKEDTRKKKMTFEEYQNLAVSTAIYSKEYETIHPALGLCDKTGEMAEKIKRSIKDGVPDEQRDSFREDILKDLSDALWYVAVLANGLNIPLDDVRENSIQKGPIYRGLDIYPEINVK